MPSTRAWSSRPTPTSCRGSIWPSGSDAQTASLPSRAQRGIGSERRQRRFPGVVAVDPVDVGDALAPDVLARGELHLRRPLVAGRLVAGKRVLDAEIGRASCRE